MEVIGIHSPKLKDLTDDCFFVRHGKRIYDRSRYQLDFRNPKVIAHANEVIDRVVNEYGVGYIKMDYNIEPGIGTELQADSYGEGLLAHERAYLAWLDVRQIYPQEENAYIRVNEDHTISVTFERPIMARLFEIGLPQSHWL